MLELEINTASAQVLRASWPEAAHPEISGSALKCKVVPSDVNNEGDDDDEGSFTALYLYCSFSFSQQCHFGGKETKT